MPVNVIKVLTENSLRFISICPSNLRLHGALFLFPIPRKVYLKWVSQTILFRKYGVPKFVENGYYVDIPFQCAQCGKEEVWTGNQQKWWYEVAKGYVYSSAKHCRTCRRREQRRRAEARRIHLEGVERKKKQQV